MSEILDQNPKEVMAKNGKTFYFASLLFEPDRMLKVARLYQICRLIDDTADELSPHESRLGLQNLRYDLEDDLRSSTFQKMVSEVCSWGVQREQLLALLSGAELDQTTVRIQTQPEFLRYCYLVAGVVGEMMCPLLGCSEKSALGYARDLGIAMQITNICRDVLEDALKGRVYLAHEVLCQYGVHEFSCESVKASSELKTVLQFYLNLADEFYESGYNGLAYLPLRARICVLLAGELYRAIGTKIRKSGFEVLKGRQYLSINEKIIVSLKTARFLFAKKFWMKSSLASPFEKYEALT